MLAVASASSNAKVAGLYPARTSESCIAALSDPVKVGQLLLPIVSDPASAAAYAGQGLITGVVAIGKVDKVRARGYKSLLRKPSPVPLLLASDEEGGTVQRYRALLGEIPSARRLAASRTTEEAKILFAAYGKKLRSWGVSVVLAPVADVSGGPGIGTRSFSGDPQVVSAFARAAAEGYLSAGIVPVYKHFPGHGRASADTHKELASTPSLKELRKVDLVPYENLEDLEGAAVMIGHLAVPGISGGAPATVSSGVISGLLRRDLGYTGVVISDAFGMGAIAGYMPIETATVRFILAGGDILLLPTLASTSMIHASLLQALRKGTISSARLNGSVHRVLIMKGIDPCAIPAPSPVAGRD
jgi:beta-N-acetylhexosaminidase